MARVPTKKAVPLKLSVDLIAWLDEYGKLHGITGADAIEVILRKVKNRYTPETAPKPPE